MVSISNTNMPNTNMPNTVTIHYNMLCDNQINELTDLPPLLCGSCNMYHSFGGSEYNVPDISEICVCNVQQS